MSRSSVPAQHHERGVARVALAVMLLSLVAAGVFVHSWWQRTHRAAVVLPDADPVAVSGQVVRPVDAVTVDNLLRSARSAVAVQHLVTPAGANAFEDYLAARVQPAGRAAAGDALRELFPYAAEQVAANIRDGRLDDVQRQIDLLARADPSNYTLTTLREQFTARQRAALAAATVPSPSPPAPVAVAAAPPPAAVVPTRPAQSAVPTPAVAPVQVAATPVTRTPAAPAMLARVAVVKTTPPVLRRRIEPYYPRDARRAHREGWVELGFTVMPDGHVDAVHVLQAEPGKVFDLAATSAVRRWEFAPAMRDGKPVAMELRQRLDFRL